MAALRRCNLTWLSAPAIMGLLTVLAAVARFTALGHQSYWYDEAHTVWLVHFSFGRMLSKLPSTETSPPLYFVLAWVWAHLFGYGETALRSLSALAGVATVPVAYLAACQFFARRIALVAAALTASSPLLVWYSQEARAYSLMVLLTAVALLAFGHVRERPTRGWMALWSVAAILAMFTHYYAALAIVPQGIWLFIRYRRVSMVRVGVEVVIASSLTLVFLVLRQLIFLGADTNWINLTPLARRVREVPKIFALGPEPPLGIWLLVAFGVLTLVAVGLLVRRTDRIERTRARVVVGVALAGVGIVAGLIVVGFDQLDSRNMLALWLPLVLVLAAGFGAQRAGWIGSAGVAACCAIGLACIVVVGVSPRFERPNWRGLATALSDRGHRAVFAVDTCDLLPLSVYMPRLHSVPTRGADVRSVDVLVALSSSPWYVRCPRASSRGVPRQLHGLDQVGSSRVVGQFAVLRFRARTPIRVTPHALAGTGLLGVAMVQ
jgi:uncharacterized membrane protein